jgi:PAS domain S-box-containing protein
MTMALRFLDHGGEMGRRIRDADWSSHPFGALETWPATLRTALGLCLSSHHPTAIYWGPELRLLYNDAWSPIPGERHPDCLGQTAREVWTDIWDAVGPNFSAVVATGDGYATYDEPLTFLRHGVPTQTWWNYSLTAIRNETGDVCGVFNQGNETTRVVLSEQRRAHETRRLRELFEQAPGAVALLHGPDFVYEFANHSYHDLVGGRPLVGRRLIDALPEVRDTFLPLLEDVRRTGIPYRADGAEVPLFNREGGEGEIRLLDFVYQPIRDEDGAVNDVFVQANDVTERRRAEIALRESEERLQLALDSTLGVGTWDWDVVADRVTSDPRFARLYGVDPEVAAAGAPIAEFFGGIHPDDLPRVQAAIAEALEKGTRFSEEYRIVQPDGEPLWVIAQGRAHLDESGRAVRLPGISFDITKRRRAEDAAREAADDLRLATETQAFIFRLAERLRAMTDVQEILETTAETLGRRIVADRVGVYRILPDAQAQFLVCWHSDALPPLTDTMPVAEFGPANVERYRAGETLTFDDYRTAPTLAGTRIGSLAGAGMGVPLVRGGEWTACLFVNQATARHWTADEIALVEAVAETAWDAVERATAATALRESESKFRAITNSIDQMIWSSRPDGFHDYYNQRWYEFTGVPAGSTDGEGWNAMFHPDDQDRAWRAWERSLETGEPYRIEYRLRHRSGVYRWVLGSALPVHDDQGRIVRWFGSCTDIEEIVEAREVLARSRAQLEAAVVERTEQLMATEAQLRQAQKMEAVGQLTGGIAHDFNNMLAVVIGALDLLERRLAQGRTDVGRYVEAARDGATRAADLTQRLLSFSRRSALDAAPVDVNVLVGGMTELINRTIGESITVETAFTDAPWLAHTDAGQLENAILNLAVNARDAMPRGGRLTIATTNAALDAAAAERLGVAPGDYVRIAVGDTGTGMTEDVAARAFDPFFTTKSVGKGTGLGLSQAFGFARQSGGHIQIDTALGRGTTVAILLPRDRSGSAPAVRTADARGELPRGTAEERILVVEDEERVRSFSVEALRELGYTVAAAADGPSALALLDAGERADLLFTDVVMPEMTGSELAVAAAARLPELRILYTSGYTRDAVGIEGTGTGSILTKPFDVATLAARVRAALDA